ncbi:hypothetical protein OPQ81_005921 [Rhizoctonia solani]|nr:hypothetical protein OPQ81_005921 [Rhizoctonia solani]
MKGVLLGHDHGHDHGHGHGQGHGHDAAEAEGPNGNHCLDLLLEANEGAEGRALRSILSRGAVQLVSLAKTCAFPNGDGACVSALEEAPEEVKWATEDDMREEEDRIQATAMLDEQLARSQMNAWTKESPVEPPARSLFAKIRDSITLPASACRISVYFCRSTLVPVGLLGVIALHKEIKNNIPPP